MALDNISLQLLTMRKVEWIFIVIALRNEVTINYAVKGLYLVQEVSKHFNK